MLDPRPLLRSRGLRWGAATAVLLGSSLMAMFGLMFWRSGTLLFETLDKSVIEQVELLGARPTEMLPFMIASRMNHQPAVLTSVGLFDAHGSLLVGDISAVPDGLLLNGQAQAVLAPGDAAAHWRAAGKRLPDGKILVAARSSDEILNVRDDLKRGALEGIVPAVLLSLGGGALVGVATERRLRKINAIAARIAAGELHERLPGRNDGDEVDRLCSIMNEMLARLEEGLEAVRGAGENIAHDLRTPLSSLRARLERCEREADPASPLGHDLRRSIASIDQALEIVSAMLRISEIRHLRQVSGFGPVALAPVVQETVESFQPIAEDKGITLAWSAALEATVTGDRALLVEALVNLADNAVKFTPEGGEVGIFLRGTAQQPIITVSDTGPGIPAEQRGKVFRRFYRSEPSRTTPGSGLGLSIVGEVIRLHRFRIRIADGSPGCRAEILCWPHPDPVPWDAPAPGVGATPPTVSNR